MIKNYYQYINEGRQRGPLYHILSMDSLKYVIENNSIKGHNYHYISTTRNKMMNHYTGDRPSAFFKLELDGDKLSNDYKIKPYVFVSRGTGVKLDEWEEQVKTNEIKNVSKYINKIIIIKSKMDRALKGFNFYDDNRKPGYWFTSDAKKHNRMQIFIKWIKENSPTPIYIQDGSKIYKDDKYLNSLINKPVHKIDYGYALYYRGRTEIIDNDTFSQRQTLIPIDDRNDDIILPTIGESYNNLYLNPLKETYSKLKNIDKLFYYKKTNNTDYPDKFELYFVKFELYNQQTLPKDGYVKIAKLSDTIPASVIVDRLRK